MSPKKLSLPFVASLLLVIVLGVLTPSVQARYFEIEHFHSDIVVNENGTIDVTETINVHFNKRRHGIFREIPFRYVDELGDNIDMPVTVKSVSRKDGTAWKYKLSRQGNVVNVRIGDADSYVRGRQVYVIHYQVDNAILFLEDHDELYWNVTGNRWPTQIKGATADISLRTEKVSAEIESDCYTGRYGSTGSECRMERLENGASFSSDRIFHPGEGLTVVLGWDKGIVSPPSDLQMLLWSLNIKENWVFIIPLAVVLFMLFHWYRRGRDPRVRESVTVMYAPPEIEGKTVTPAQAGVLVDECLNPRDLTASLIGLAVKGYIQMRESKLEGDEQESDSKDYTLVKLRESDDQLSRFEKEMMRCVFSGQTTHTAISEMKNEFYTEVPGLRDLIFGDLVRLKCFAVRPNKIKRKYGLIGLGVLLVGTYILYNLSPYAPWKGIVAGMISGLSILLFTNAMPVKTRVGALTHMKILGFQEFMNRADKDRLERMGQDTFYKYLPYAIALDVVDHWVKAFSGMLTEAPSWYVGLGTHQHFNVHNFSQSLTTASSHLGSAMFSTPRGSGLSGGGFSGGGGGFSGGGGGGGGGGSW